MSGPLHTLMGFICRQDVGTKPVGPARFEDLMQIMELYCPHLAQPKGPPNPKVAAFKTGVTRLLIALILFNQASLARASIEVGASIRSSSSVVWLGILYGFGGYSGWTVASGVHRNLRRILCPRRPATTCHTALRLHEVVASDQLHNLLEPETLTSTAALPQVAQASGQAFRAAGLDSPSVVQASGQVTAAGLDSAQVAQASGQAFLGLAQVAQATAAGLDSPQVVQAEPPGCTSIRPGSHCHRAGFAPDAHAGQLNSVTVPGLQQTVRGSESGRNTAGLQLPEASSDHGVGSEAGFEEIDQVPHRPPSPSRDFEAYNRSVAGLTSEQYHSLFYIPVRAEIDSEGGSDVDSNERYVTGFVGPSDYPDGAIAPASSSNNNNTVGSREAAMRKAQEILCPNGFVRWSRNMGLLLQGI